MASLTSSAVIASIHTQLASKGIPPTQQWLHQFVQSIRPNTPLPALQRTAEFRLLGSDFTTSLQPSPQSVFPAGVSSPGVQEIRIPGPIPVQVLDIEDVGRSRWSQVEAIEMEEKGETRKGHEVIRVVPDEEETGSNPNPPANRTHFAAAGPHKLLVQDAKGNTAYALELESVVGVGVESMEMGRKLVLRDLTVARGVILLTTRGTEVLGGKIDAWDKEWRLRRKGALKEKAGWRENANDTRPG